MLENSYEVFQEKTRHLTVEVKGGEVEAFDTAIEEGTAVRVISSSKMGFSFSTKNGEEPQRLIEEAKTSAAFADEDADLIFPTAATCSTFSDDEGPFIKMSAEDKINMAKRLEASARAFDKRIIGVRKSSYSESIREVSVTNSNGVSVKYKKSLCGVRATVIASDGVDSEWATEVEYGISPLDINVEELGKSAAKKAISYLGGKNIPTVVASCVIDRHIVSEFLELAVGAFFADAVHKKRSPIGDKLGKRHYSNLLTMIDDGTLPRGFASVPCDAEGTPARKNVFVEKGVIKQFLADAYYGKKLGIGSTASSIRGSISTLPKIGTHNLYIEPGVHSLNDLMKLMKSGFYVTDALGLHTANQITGDFSIGASGFWVKDGVPAFSVKGVTIAGNIHEVLGRVSAVGSDVKFFGSKGGVSLLVPDVAVSGS